MRRTTGNVSIDESDHERRVRNDHVEALLAREFPLESDLIYLNHAGVAPWPRRTAAAIDAFIQENTRQGAKDYPRWLQTESRLRTQLARLINAPSPDDIALLKNTSEALSVVAHGFPWQTGDSVIISDEEFPSNRIVWESLARYGVHVRQVPLTGVAQPEQALVSAADASTRLLSISSVQYASGLRLDLTRLGELCHQRKIAFCVDAIQGLGILPHDVQSAQIDFLMTDGHKWLLAPEGTALFYCSARWREQLALYQHGWHMVQDHGNYDRKDWEAARSARRFECGSPNMLGIHALSASLSLLEEIGVAEIERRVLERAEHLFALIRARPHLALITDASPGRHAGIVTFRHAQADSGVLARHLQKNQVVCAQRGGGIRFSPHCYTRMDQLDRAVAILDSVPG